MQSHDPARNHPRILLGDIQDGKEKLKGRQNMTSKDAEIFRDGCDLWCEYVRLNGYAWEPTAKGLSKMARLLDLKVGYIRKRINFYLQN
jgi:hypothetical protein